jgi:hypothetical protein
MKSFAEQYINTKYIQQKGRVSQVSLTENKKTYKAYNTNNLDLSVYQVDGGIITSTAIKKCDFAIYTETDSLYLIELKGSDYKQAIDQLCTTIDNFKTTCAKPNKVFTRIVLSKTPTPNITQNLELKVKKKIKEFAKSSGDHKKGTKLYTETTLV